MPGLVSKLSYISRYAVGPHALSRGEDGIIRCSVCLRAWRSEPKTECIGVPVWQFENTPEYAKSKSALRAMHLKPAGGQSMCGAWLWYGNKIVELYDMRQAVSTERHRTRPKEA